jgi:hypothetical protein
LRDVAPLLKGFSQAAEHAGNFIRVTVKFCEFGWRQETLVPSGGSVSNNLAHRSAGITNESGEVRRWTSGAFGDIRRNEAAARLT